MSCGSLVDAGVLPGGDLSRDPVRPFRQPLLGVALPDAADTGVSPLPDSAWDGVTREARRKAPPIGEGEAEQLRADVQSLLDDDHPCEAILVLEAGLARAAPGSLPELRMRHALAAALLMARRYAPAA